MDSCCVAVPGVLNVPERFENAFSRDKWFEWFARILNWE